MSLLSLKVYYLNKGVATRKSYKDCFLTDVIEYCKVIRDKLSTLTLLSVSCYRVAQRILDACISFNVHKKVPIKLPSVTMSQINDSAFQLVFSWVGVLVDDKSAACDRQINFEFS